MQVLGDLTWVHILACEHFTNGAIYPDLYGFVSFTWQQEAEASMNLDPENSVQDRGGTVIPLHIETSHSLETFWLEDQTRPLL